MTTLEARPGDHISAFAQRLCENAPARGTFNDIELTATPGCTAGDVESSYHTQSQARQATYEASPEGKAARERQREYEARAARAVAEGILPFDVADQDAWDKTVAANHDGYGACVVRYAARWASLMDVRLKAGSTVADCADEASTAADVEGITGFMYGCAVGILAKVWRHGEELRRWHNLKTQIGTEGERANESGETLNPALLTIG